MKGLIGAIAVSSALFAFGDEEIRLENCSTTVTATVTAPFGDAALTLRGTDLLFSPGLSSGETWSGTLGAVTADRGANRLGVSRGSGVSATVTLDALTTANNGTLVISAGKGVAALGDTEKVVVKEKTAEANVPPSMVTRQFGSANSPYHPLAYDYDKGYVAIDCSSVPKMGAGATTYWSSAQTTGNIKFTGDQKVFGGHLYITSTGTVELASGKTMSFDSYWAPIGIFLSHSAQGKNLNFYIKGGNGISIARGDVYFWTSAQSTTWNTGIDKGWGRIVFIQTPIVHNQWGPFTFAGHANDTREYPSYDIGGDYIKWNGATHISGARLKLSSGAASFQNEVYVHGGTSLTAGQLMLGTESGTINHKVHLAGEGPSGAGAVHNTGTCSWTFAGGTVLEGDTYITHDNTTCGTVFRGTVEGAGRLALGNGRFDFHAAGSNSGGMELRQNSTVVNVFNDGTLGTGPVVAANDDLTPTVNFVGQYRALQPAIDIPNGAINITDSRIDSFGGLKAKTVTLDGLVDATVTGDVSLGQFAQTGLLRLTAGSDPVTVGVGGDGDDFTFGAELNDGEGDGRVGFAKTGSNTVTLYRAGTASGPLSVKDGTLKLTDDLYATPELAWWLDASQPSTITRDGAGRVTEWRSANGNGVAFTPSTFGENTCTSPTYTGADATDGLPGVSFVGGETNGLAANVATVQRMVVLVLRPASEQIQWTGGVFGRLNSDYGQRYTSASYWNRDNASASFHSGFPYARLNGEDVNYNLTFAGTLHLAVFTHDEVANADSPSVTGNRNLQAERFVPALGGYFNPFFGDGVPRFFTGEICEAMAFSRILSADELARVENALAKKWLNRAVHGDVPDYEALPEGTTVTADAGATLEIDCPIKISVDENGVVNPLVVDGKVKLGPKSVLTVEAKSPILQLPHEDFELISAGEGIEGAFASVKLPRSSWKLSVRDGKLVLDHQPGMFLILR